MLDERELCGLTADEAGADAPGTLTIRRVLPIEREALVDIWLRSVRATHAFLSEADIEDLLPFARAYLTSDDSDLWVLASGPEIIAGFMGMSGSEVEALFLAPEFHRRGGGRLLIRHAQALAGELTVAVNEQNDGARRFYEACGFIVERRSELDDAGRPFPLLHMRLRAPAGDRDQPPRDAQAA